MRSVAYDTLRESLHRLWRRVAVVACYGRGDAKTWGAAIKARILGRERLKLKLVGDGRDEVYWWLALDT
jgi:hypothetical protein